MGRQSQLATAPPNKGANSGAAWTVPDPTRDTLFSMAWGKLVARRLNALINMRSSLDQTVGNLLISDANSVLPVSSSILAGSNGTPATGMLQQYRFKSLTFVSGATGSITAVPWDGVTEGMSTAIILPTKLQNITSEVIDSVTVNYSSYNNSAQTRFADNGTTTETQVITPRYLFNDIFFVLPVNFFFGPAGGGGAGGMIDVNIDGRAWAGPA